MPLPAEVHFRHLVGSFPPDDQPVNYGSRLGCEANPFHSAMHSYNSKISSPFRLRQLVCVEKSSESMSTRWGRLWVGPICKSFRRAMQKTSPLPRHDLVVLQQEYGILGRRKRLLFLQPVTTDARSHISKCFTCPTKLVCAKVSRRGSKGVWHSYKPSSRS